MNTPIFPYPCIIQADHHQLSQVVRNLVSNAIKFSQNESSVKVTVDVVTSDDTSLDRIIVNKIQLLTVKEKQIYFIRLSVTDTGAGISKVTFSNILS